MEIKLFGKKLFEFNNRGALFLETSVNNLKESKYLPDFMVNFNNSSDSLLRLADYAVMAETGNGGMIIGPKNLKKSNKEKMVKPEPVKKEITPKGIYEMKFLNNGTYKLNTDEKYVDQQILDFKDKLNLIKKEEYDMRNGVAEISSILIRMENRKKYIEVKDFIEQYPYTTTARINELVKEHSHLKLGKIAEFLADLPKEAVDTMKEYNKNTQKLCQKDSVFYIVANKKDFQKSEKRRDPILLAQSPFSHTWQILGAWDEEMLLLEDL